MSEHPEWVTHCPDVPDWRMRIMRRATSTDDTSACWLWLGQTSQGYGVFHYRAGRLNRQTSAHRASYLAFVDDIGTDLVVDHLCHNRACVNPRHLEPVTSTENTRRGDRGPLGGPRRQQCANGHPTTDETIATVRGRRWCAACFPGRGRTTLPVAVEYDKLEDGARLADMMQAIERHRAS